MPFVGDDGRTHHTHEERAIFRAATLAAHFARREQYVEAQAAMLLGTRVDRDDADGDDTAEFVTFLERLEETRA